MHKKWKNQKANQQNSKKHKNKIKEKKGENRKVKKGKNGETMDLSICIFFAFILLFRFAYLFFSVFKFCFLMFDVFSFFLHFSSLKIIRINYRGEHKGIITPKRSKKCILWGKSMTVDLEVFYSQTQRHAHTQTNIYIYTYLYPCLYDCKGWIMA